MICEKTMAKILGFHELFLPCFFVFHELKEVKEKAIKQALVNKSKESIIESRIMRLS